MNYEYDDRRVDPVALTPRESAILRLLIDGHTNREIGARLYITPKTVKNHLYEIYPKLGVSSRLQAAMAVAHGAVTLPSEALD